jgi:hypothetical protein
MVFPAVAAICLFAVCATMPLIQRAVDPHPEAAAGPAQVSSAPAVPPPIVLPPVARPPAQGGPPAGLPAVDRAGDAKMVTAEDIRLAAVLKVADTLLLPEAVPYPGALPTLVLTARRASYTAADLAHYHVLVLLSHQRGLLVDSVLVMAGAQLDLGTPQLRALYLASPGGRFASIVGWGGGLSFAGTAAQPLTITTRTPSTRDLVAAAPAADGGHGRSYIREVAGRMTLSHARVSALGFWSGRTGGVAWTGTTARPATGSAASSTFTGGTYGVFISGGRDIVLRADLFAGNQLDGLHIHRSSTGTSVLFSAAAANGGNGFSVTPQTRVTLLRDDVAVRNGGNGFFLDDPLPGSGAAVENSAALRNRRTGILVEGGIRTELRDDSTCSATAGIAVKGGAAGTVISGSSVRCGPSSGLAIGPSAPGTVLSGNSVAGARIGLSLRSPGTVTVDRNWITGVTVLGIAARGQVTRVTGTGNVISGTGYQAVASSAGSPPLALAGTDTSGWAVRGPDTLRAWLVNHPLVDFWLVIAAPALIHLTWSRRRPLPAQPYPERPYWPGTLASRQWPDVPASRQWPDVPASRQVNAPAGESWPDALAGEP